MRVGGVAAVPTDTIPKQTMISGQPHMLAYINPQEAQLLQDRGGIGSLFGIPTFFNPEDDMGLESSLADQQAVSAGMGVTSTEGDQGTGTEDFDLSPFGGMGPNVSVNTKGNVTGIAGFDPNNTLDGSGAAGPSFSITPSQIGRGITSLLSLVPNPIQPLAQMVSKGLAVRDIGNVIGGDRSSPLGGIVSTIENFSLSDLTSDLAARARGEK